MHIQDQKIRCFFAGGLFLILPTFLLPVALVPGTAIAEEEMPPMPKGPLVLTSTKSEQLTADYWINRLPNPEQVLKTPEELKQFNEEITKMAPVRVNIFQTESLPRGSEIRSVIREEYSVVSNRKFFDVAGAVVPKSLFEYAQSFQHLE